MGICLRARKYKLIEFEGEMLFQRRDDDVPIFLLKPIKEIRQILDDKTEDIKRGASPAPQATSVLMDKRSRSASPNMRKGEIKGEETAKVPEKKESEKGVEEITKIDEKTDDSIKILQAEPVVEVENTKIKESSQEKLDANNSSSCEVTEKHTTQENVIEPAVIVVNDGENPQPTIIVNDEDNNAVILDGASTNDEVSESIDVEEAKMVSASSSVLEIIEEMITVKESKADENNNTSNDKLNDNFNPD